MIASHSTLAAIGSEQLDYLTYLSFLEGDEELAHELIAVFFDSGDELLDELKRACQKGDTESLLRLAHGFKGASASIHARQCQQAACSLENAARERNSDTFESLLEELSGAYHQLKVAVTG